MVKENKLEPSRWSPPDDLAQAYSEGKATKRLHDGSTASLSWTPEMKDRWWSYDGAIGFNDGLQVIEHSNDGPQLAPYSARGGNGIMLVPDSEIEDELSIITKREPTGQPWSYSPHGTNILTRPINIHVMTSWKDSFPAILVSHDGRIILDEYYSARTPGGYALSKIMETDEHSKCYVDRLFQSLYLYLRRSPRESLKQPDIINGWLVNGRLRENGWTTWTDGERASDSEISQCAHSMWKLVDSKRIELVKKPRCARLRNLKEWILALPLWASVIISARLANAGGLSLLTEDSHEILSGNTNSINDLANNIYCDANVANRCYNLLVLANEKIYNNDKSMSYEELALEYGPCWLMQSLITLDRSPYSPDDDNTTSLDLVHNNDHWETSINHDRVLASCKLAGAMNAPIELWPRFYSILENLGKQTLDEITVLIALATPIREWNILSRALDVTSGQAKLIREACCLITAGMIRRGIRELDGVDDVEQVIMGTLSPVRPIASQIVDLAMSLDDDVDNVKLRSVIDYSMELITDKPIMTGTINGVSLIASDLNSLNISEN